MKSPRLRYSFLLLTASTVLLAQEYRGTIAGIVTDTTGFPVAGEYTAAALLPGEYQIAVRISGFKEYLRKAVHVGAGDRVVIDVRQELGDATQVVEVTADAPLINTENASVGQPITTKEIEDLPLNGGTPVALSALSIGVVGAVDRSSRDGWTNGSTTTPGDYIYSGGALNLNNRNANSVAFDTTQFVTDPAKQLQYHLRTFATTFGNLRQDGINQFDGSTIKYFKPTETTKLQIRFEVFNLLNHPTFTAPNTTAINSAFGTITAQSNRPRAVQIGARLSF